MPSSKIKNNSTVSKNKINHQIDKRQTADLVLQLMAIEGKSGDEGQVADYIIQALKSVGVTQKMIRFDTAHKRTPIAGNVGNMVLKLPGTMRGPRRMFSAHMDTVPICVGCRPIRKGNKIITAGADTGLGADDRAGCAVILNTVLTILKKELPHPPLTFLWVIQEEVGLQGARNLSKGLLGKPKLAFNFDGGSPEKITIGATGGYRMEILVHGVASHAGNAPQEGVSAIAIASLAIADLQQRGWHGDVHKNGKHGTSNVGVFHGGAATNVVTDLVTIRAEARSHDPKFRKLIVKEIEKAFQKAVKQIKSSLGVRGSVVIDGHLDYESFQLQADEPSVHVAMQAIHASGGKPELAICNGGLDANWLVQHGILTVTLGCGQQKIHTTAEQLDLPMFWHACQIALRLGTTK